MLDFQILKDIILKNNTFLITTHVNPDADAIGSELVLFRLLRRLNKEVHIRNHSGMPYNLKFLDPENNILKYEDKTDAHLFSDCDVIFFLDLNQFDRVKSMEEVSRLSGKIKIVIDHHLNPEDGFNYKYLDNSYSATAEILYDFIKTTGIVEIDREIAVPMYAGIVTDTGSFRYERTAPRTHYAAAELLENGVDPNWVMEEIYDKGRLSRFKLMGDALSSLTLNKTGEVAYMIVTQESLKRCSADETEVDGFVNFTMSINGVKIGMLFYELPDGFKVSFRTKGDIPANSLAAKFGGGGHSNASGARMYGKNYKEFINVIVQEAESIIP